MRCETSFFSLTLYKKLLTRYWPLWTVWLVGWFLSISVPIWNAREGEPAVVAARVGEAAPALAAMLAPMAILTAVLVFFYLFKSSSTDMMLSLPFRREGLFFTAFLAGLTILLVPLALVALLTLGVEGAVGAVALRPLLEWLGGGALAAFFWFSFATLCCVVSGSSIAAACFFCIFNAVVPVMFFLVESLCHAFLFGFGGFGTGVEEAIGWCTPLLRLFRQSPTWWETAWIYAAVGFLMFLAALGLHHIRRAERAGDLVSFTALRYAFKVSVILCGGLSLGTLLTVLIFGGYSSSEPSGGSLTLCCCVAAVIAAFVAEMLLRKTFRVLKSWPWAAVSALVFALLLSGLQYDVMGYVPRIPAPASVEQAVLNVDGNDLPGGDMVSGSALLFEGEDVSALTAFHTQLLDHRDDLTDGDNFRDVSLRYTLSSGRTLRRTYYLSLDPNDPLEQTLRAAIQRGKVFFPTDETPTTLSIQREWPEKNYGTSFHMDELETMQLWQAVVDDVENGRYHPQETDTHDTILFFSFPKGGPWNDEIYSLAFYPSPSTTATNRTLALLDLPADPDLFPEGAEGMGVGTQVVP